MSYDLLPALSVRKAELRWSMRRVTSAWALGIVWMTCVRGSWMNSFRVMLGFNNIHFGLMTAIPPIATLANLAAVVYVERTGFSKAVFIVSKVASRSLWLVVALILVTLGGTPAGIWLVLGTVLLIWTLDSVGTPAWQTWMGDMIPRRIRGRYWAARAQITRLIVVPVAIGLSIFMDAMTDSARPITIEAQPQLMWALAGLLVGASIFGVADILMFLRIREVRPTVAEEVAAQAQNATRATDAALGERRGKLGAIVRLPVGLVSAVRELLLSPMRDRAFRRYVMYGATVAFAMFAGGPFYFRNMRENLGLSHMAINIIFLVLGPLMAILASRPWGRLIDRWGRRPALMAATAVAMFGAVPYLFASRYTPNPPFVAEGVNAAAGWLGQAAATVVGWFGWSVGWGQWQPVSKTAPVGAWLICATTMFFGFVGWAGVMIGQQGIVLGFADGPGRSRYVAAYTACCGLGGFLGAMCGAELAQGLADASWYHPLRVGVFEWNNWHATFALSTLGRVTALLMLINMPDPGARRARDMARSVGAEMLGVLTGRPIWSWLGFGRGRRNTRRPRR